MWSSHSHDDTCCLFLIGQSVVCDIDYDEVVVLLVWVGIVLQMDISYRGTCLTGGHILQKDVSYGLTEGNVLQEDMSYLRTYISGGHI